MALAVYTDTAGRHYWAETTSPSTLQKLARGEWTLFDATPDDPPPPGDPFDVKMKSLVEAGGSGTAAAIKSLVAAGLGSPGNPIGDAGRAAFGRRGNRAVILGDSIAAGSDTMNNYAVGGSWFSRLCEATGQRLRYTRNAGVAGNTSSAMLARIQTDVIAYNPDVCVLEGVTPNDPGQGVTVAQSKANIVSMLNALRSAGIRVIVCTGPPNDTTATNDHLRTVSAWMVEYANNLGLPVFDLHTPVADPADGTYLASLTSDGTHPNADGQEAIVAYLKTRLPQDLYGVPLLSAGKTSATNLITNGVFVGDSNADGLADGWTNNGVGSFSLVPIPGGPGNWQQLTAASGTAYISANLTSGWAVGDVLVVAGRWEQDSTSALIVQTNCTGGTPYSQPRALSSRTTVVTDRTFHHEFPIPSGTTSVQLRLVPGVGTARFGQVTVRNRTALGL